jgi:hypothetical protein
MNQDRNPNPQPPSALTTDQPTSGEPTTERPLQTPPGTVPQLRTADTGVGPILLGCLVWVVVILSTISMLSVTARQFLYHRWWAVGGGIIALALLGWLIGLRKWFTKAAEEKRTAVVVFVFLPLLLVVFGTIFLIPLPEYRITVVRSIFLVAVCLFPALLYYLFILARRISLLNDYFVNLEKLGLLKEHPESGTNAMIERTVRVNTYLQKFEALYGPLDPGLRLGITAMNNPLFILSQTALGLVSPPAPGSVSPPAQDSVSSRGIPIFSAETAIPVVLATILIAIGWLMALPPTGFEKVQQATTASQSSTQKAEESSPTPGPGSPPPASTPAQSHNEQSSLAQGKREDVTAPAALTASTQLTSPALGAPTAAPGSPSQAPTANQSDEKQASLTARKGEGVTPSATPVKPPPQKFAGEEKEGNSSAFWSVAFRVTPDPIIYAFLGAYFFSLQMLFRRYVSEDLRKSAYLAVSLRIVLAVIGTWASITAIKAMWEGVNAEWLLVVGFVIGVFPRIAWQFIQGAWKALMQKSGLSAALPSMEVDYD